MTSAPLSTYRSSLLTRPCGTRTSVSLHDALCITSDQTFPTGRTTREEGEAAVGGFAIMPLRVNEVVVTGVNRKRRQHDQMATFKQQKIRALLGPSNAEIMTTGRNRRQTTPPTPPRGTQKLETRGIPVDNTPGPPAREHIV